MINYVTPPFIARKMAGIRFPSEHAVKYGAGEWQAVNDPSLDVLDELESGSAVSEETDPRSWGRAGSVFDCVCRAIVSMDQVIRAYSIKECNFLDATSWLAVRFKRRLSAL